MFQTHREGLCNPARRNNPLCNSFSDPQLLVWDRSSENSCSINESTDKLQRREQSSDSHRVPHAEASPPSTAVHPLVTYLAGFRKAWPAWCAADFVVRHRPTVSKPFPRSPDLRLQVPAHSCVLYVNPGDWTKLEAVILVSSYCHSICIQPNRSAKTHLHLSDYGSIS